MAQSQSSELDGPVYFWGEKSHDYDFLSQWYPCAFTAPGPVAGEPPLTFRTTEQYMMYRKAVLFEDGEVADKIMAAATPREQKKLGRQVKNFDNKTWVEHREAIVEEGNWNKFTNSKEETQIAARLLATGDRLLVEVCFSH